MDNPFKEILAKGLAMLKMGGSSSSESVVGIDIGASSIKVVQLKRKGGKAVLETYGALSLGPYGDLDVGNVTNLPEEKLGVATVDVLKESDITSKSCALSIPSSASLVFLIDIPAAVPEKEFANIIPTEARKYIPVPISEVSLDWWAIPKKEESLEEATTETVAQKTEILVAAIHNETISKYRDIVKRANLSADFFEIEVFSNIRSTFGHELSPVLLLDLGASKTKLSIVEHGIVRSFHIINRGGFDMTTALSKSLSIPFTKAEQMKKELGLTTASADKSVAEILKLSVDYIISETNSVVLAYEKKYNRTISKVILTGGGSLLKGFLEIAQDNFHSEVILGNPFGKVEAPAFLEHALESAGPEFSVAVGLALRKLS